MNDAKLVDGYALMPKAIVMLAYLVYQTGTPAEKQAKSKQPSCDVLALVSAEKSNSQRFSELKSLAELLSVAKSGTRAYSPVAMTLLYKVLAASLYFLSHR